MTTLSTPALEALLEQLGVNIPIPQFQAADVLNRPLDIGRSYLADIFCNISECDPETAYKSIYWPNFTSNGDLAVILPKLGVGTDLNAVAFQLIEKFPKSPLFNLPFHDGVHLRIIFRPQTVSRLLLPYMHDRQGTYGQDISLGLRDPSSPDLGRKNLVIEFSSPNIANEFQAKHLRSTIFGAHIANLYEHMGWNVTKINYLGDWGKPIGLLGVGWEKFGSEELFEADPAGHLLDIYHQIQEMFIPELAASKKVRDEGGDPAEIESQGLFAERNAFFKRMEDGDEQAVAFWKRVRSVNIDNYTNLYARLNVSFNEYSGESQVSPDTMAEVEEILKSKGLLEQSLGSWVIDLKKHTGKSGMAIIRDRTGSSTYLLRDLAAVLERSRTYSFDKMIYVVAADQHNVHFARLFKILELMDMADLAAKLQHVNFSDSSNTLDQQSQGHGNMLDEILQQCQDAMRDSLTANPEKSALLGETEDSISSTAIAALLVEVLSSRRASDHKLDIDRMTSFEPGTGPDLQYWYAKLSSIVVEKPLDGTDHLGEAELKSEDEVELLRLLIQYPEITRSAYDTLEPAVIMGYLVNVTGQLELCLENVGDGANTSAVQALLYKDTQSVLSSGMKLLGVRHEIKPQVSVSEEAKVDVQEEENHVPENIPASGDVQASNEVPISAEGEAPITEENVDAEVPPVEEAPVLEKESVSEDIEAPLSAEEEAPITEENADAEVTPAEEAPVSEKEQEEVAEDMQVSDEVPISAESEAPIAEEHVDAGVPPVEEAPVLEKEPVPENIPASRDIQVSDEVPISTEILATEELSITEEHVDAEIPPVEEAPITEEHVDTEISPVEEAPVSEKEPEEVVIPQEESAAENVQVSNEVPVPEEMSSAGEVPESAEAQVSLESLSFEEGAICAEPISEIIAPLSDVVVM